MFIQFRDMIPEADNFCWFDFKCHQDPVIIFSIIL